MRTPYYFLDLKVKMLPKFQSITVLFNLSLELYDSIMHVTPSLYQTTILSALNLATFVLPNSDRN